MDLSILSITEIIQLYSQSIKELKKRGVLRTNNVVGELGEYLVLDHYSHSCTLPTLNQVPVGTQNINAIGQDGNRYAIKSTSGHVTGVFYGLEPPESSKPDIPLFEYVIICKFDEDCMMQAIYQMNWSMFLKHKKWHSRMRAWNLALTQNLISDSTIIFDRKDVIDSNAGESTDEETISDIDSFSIPETVIWDKTKEINHAEVKEKAARLFEQRYNLRLNRLSAARYESIDKSTAAFIMSASYSQKNKEYWYSIADENLPWLQVYPKCYIIFALGSPTHLLVFELHKFEEMLAGCLHTAEDQAKRKVAHYHISFSVENNGKIYFKKKKPSREFEDVSSAFLGVP